MPGAIVATIVLRTLPELMREFADLRMLLYAIVLIVVMLATNNPTMRGLFEKLKHPAEFFKRKAESKLAQKEEGQ